MYGNKNTLLALETKLPKYHYSNEEVIEQVKKWLCTQDEAFINKAVRIFKGSGITKRHSIAPIEVLFSKRTLKESNELYMQEAIRLGEVALMGALEKACLQPKDIDIIITTSCTGFMIPSFDAYVVNKLDMKSDIKRIPITEIGCAAGVSAWILAHDFIKAYPESKVAIISLEFPSNTIQVDNYSWDNIVSTAIFADGVSCSIWGNSDKPGLKVVDTQMYHVKNTTGVIGYDLHDGGFVMRLQKEITNVIAENFKEIIIPFLKKNHLQITDIDKYLVHPGGIKIIEMIELLMREIKKDVSESREIMQKYGNLSSATIGFILENYLQTKTSVNDNVLALGFGPGFMAHSILLKEFR